MVLTDELAFFLKTFDAELMQYECDPAMQKQFVRIFDAYRHDPVSTGVLIDAVASRVLKMRHARHVDWIVTTLVDVTQESEGAQPHVDKIASMQQLQRALVASDLTVPATSNSGNSTKLAIDSNIEPQPESEDFLPAPALRGIFALVPSIAEPTFLCQICYEHAPCFTAFTLSNCEHRFCQPCLARYLEIKIRDGWTHLSCFHEVDTRACGTQISPSDIQAVVSNDLWIKYNTFKFKKETQHPGECPYCGFTQACEGPEHPEVNCDGCHLVYCYLHGRAHEGSSCADFELKQSETEKLSRLLVVKTSKPCPGCKRNVVKEGDGCNTLQCTVCSTKMCWVCGKRVIDSSVHFSWASGNGCSGRQFQLDGKESWLFRLMSVLNVIQPFTVLLPCLQLLGVPYAYTVLSVFTSCFFVISIGWLKMNPLELAAWLHTKMALVLVMYPIILVCKAIMVTMRCIWACLHPSLWRMRPMNRSE